MTKSNFKISTYESIKKDYNPEQILAYFDIEITTSNKCLCVFHKEKTPSMQVYEDGVYCFGCRMYTSSFTLAKHLLETKCGKEVSVSAVISWFNETKFNKKSNRKYTTSAHYSGEVSQTLIDYWHNQLDEEKYQQLSKERLITRETIDRYRLGWRPDGCSWVIPYYRGELGNSLVDTVQFRHVEGEPKYYGLYSHVRGSFMNAHLLEQSQEYIVNLFGAFDSITALQDGIIACATNGCFPFKPADKERVQQAFSKQEIKFVIPDNTPKEYDAAYKLAEWIGAEVRFFDTELPEGCDYIDFRKLGYTAVDFKQDVLGIQPITEIDSQYVEDIKSYLSKGDPYRLSSVYAIMSGKGLVAADVARTLAQNCFKPFSQKTWAKIKKELWSVKTENDLFKTLDKVANEANRLSGAW